MGKKSISQRKTNGVLACSRATFLNKLTGYKLCKSKRQNVENNISDHIQVLLLLVCKRRGNRCWSWNSGSVIPWQTNETGRLRCQTSTERDLWVLIKCICFKALNLTVFYLRVYLPIIDKGVRSFVACRVTAVLPRWCRCRLSYRHHTTNKRDAFGIWHHELYGFHSKNHRPPIDQFFI